MIDFVHQVRDQLVRINLVIELNLLSKIRSEYFFGSTPIVFRVRMTGPSGTLTNIVYREGQVAGGNHTRGKKNLRMQACFPETAR